MSLTSTTADESKVAWAEITAAAMFPVAGALAGVAAGRGYQEGTGRVPGGYSGLVCEGGQTAPSNSPFSTLTLHPCIALLMV